MKNGQATEGPPERYWILKIVHSTHGLRASQMQLAKGRGVDRLVVNRLVVMARLLSFARLDSPFGFAQGRLRWLSSHKYRACSCVHMRY